MFLSYSTVDRLDADEVRDGLEACGFEVWTEDFIPLGSNLSEVVGVALEAADAYVVLITKHAAKSQWLPLEIGAAIASGKRVIPVLVDPDADVPAMLRDRQYLDLTDRANRSAAIRRLCEALRARAPDGEAHEREGGRRFLERASSALESERVAYESEVGTRSARFARIQMIASVLAVLATCGALLTVSVSDTAAAGLVTAITALLGSALGFYFGSERRRGGRE